MSRCFIKSKSSHARGLHSSQAQYSSVPASISDGCLPAGLAEPFVGLPLPRLECDSDNMEQQPKDRIITADRVAALRRRMLSRGLDAYIVPYSDEHQVRPGAA